MIDTADIAVVRGVQQDLLALNARVQAVASRAPRVLNDPVFFAWGQINSAVRYLEVAILKAGGAPSDPAVIG